MNCLPRQITSALHLPKTKESANMIGAEQFAKMKNGVRIINCARGGIVNEDALYEALTSGKVAGAALDVFAEEPPTDWKLLKLDNVIASPHIGAATKEAQARVGAEVAPETDRLRQEHAASISNNLSLRGRYARRAIALLSISGHCSSHRGFALGLLAMTVLFY